MKRACFLIACLVFMGSLCTPVQAETEMHRVIVEYNDALYKTYTVATNDEVERIVSSAKREFCIDRTASQPTTVIMRSMVGGNTVVPFEGVVHSFVWGSPRIVWTAARQRCTPGDLPADVFGVTHSSDETVVRYAEFDGRPVDLVYQNDTGRVSLRIYKRDTEIATGDHLLEFLRNEVLRLTSSTKPIELGETGIMFRFTEGHPIWAPYQELGADYLFQYLFFGEAAIMKDGTLETSGRPEVVGYDGYRLWNRPHLEASNG